MKLKIDEYQKGVLRRVIKKRIFDIENYIKKLEKMEDDNSEQSIIVQQNEIKALTDLINQLVKW